MLKKVLFSITVAGLIVLALFVYISQKVADYYQSKSVPQFQPLQLVSDSRSSFSGFYQNPDHGLSFNYPKDYQLEENSSLTVKNHLHQVRLIETKSRGNHTAWLFGIWKPVATDYQILSLYYPDFEQVSEHEVYLSGRKAREIILRGPFSKISQNLYYRLYIVRTPRLTFSFTSEFCHQNLSSQCTEVMSHIRISNPATPQ